ncbi:hypothetical protein TNCV_3652531 [Trichonephila clavipes]|nr:hypothetical protein TNCV_3652531 [Trichonephila clavipes]
MRRRALVLYEQHISDGYEFGESQELDLNLTISLKNTASVMLVSGFGQGYQSGHQLISTSFSGFSVSSYLSGCKISSTHIHPYYESMFMDDNVGMYRIWIVNGNAKHFFQKNGLGVRSS